MICHIFTSRPIRVTLLFSDDLSHSRAGPWLSPVGRGVWPGPAPLGVINATIPISFVRPRALTSADGSVTFQYLNPGDAPEATFCKPSENATVYEYCNLHGLWKAEYTA